MLQDFERGQKTLWVTSPGGHLAELLRIESNLGPSPDSLWVVPETPQSRSLLADRRTLWVDYVPPRDLRGALRVAETVRRNIKHERFRYALSAGAAIASGVLPYMAMRGAETAYIESLARPQGPSVTGHLMRRVPRVATFTQYENQARGPWRYAGSVLDKFVATEKTQAPPASLKVLVTLGTIRPYRFDRLLDAVTQVLEPHDTVTWQLGATDRSDLPGTAHVELPMEDLLQIAEESDIVISHAGVGTILDLLDRGISPVLAPRAAEYGEHVDGHQSLIAGAMQERGLTSTFDPSAPMSREQLLATTRRKVSAGL